MRLKKLTMRAFGPFKDEVEIDFENERINKGLLLISGDTGAGKTTIFDAVCFALYGKASGEFRGSNGLKSDFAADDVVPYVNLEFYYKNKFYEVRRTPEYSKPKSDGSGEIKKSQTVQTEINGRKLTKKKEADKELAELIGLDYKQFRQVAMLSQGEFTKFLLADSKEKTTIFRKIFDTEFYDILQNELKERMFSKKREIESVKDKIDTEKKNLKDIIDVFGLNNDETIDALTEKITEDEKIVNETKEARDKKEAEKTEMFNELDKIRKLNENILTYQEACKNKESLLAENPKIEEEKVQYDYNIKVANPISKVLTALNINSKSLGEKNEQCVKHRECLETKMNECKEKEEDFKKLDAYPAEAEKLANEINDFVNLDNVYESYLNKSDELDETKNKYKEISKEHEEQNGLYESIRQKYYLNASVELADTLVDGAPCPVCGSTDHPNKAIAADSEYTKEDVENAEKIVKDLDGKRKKCEAKIEEMEKIIAEYDIPEDLDVKVEKEKNLKLLGDKKEEKEKLDTEFKELTEARQELDSTIKTIKGKIEMFEKDIKQHEDNIKSHNLELEKLYKDNDTDYDDYISKKLDEDDLSKLKAKIENFDEKKTKYESIIEHLEEEVKDKEVVDVSEMEKAYSSVEEEYKKLDTTFLELSGTLKQLT
ncbi:MAG: SMC family ATPase, partial [Methanobrevibacter sp.]|uniref:AAA family ATPase n=1 Tax=Methanobrevibacter sp. TaxID=66852 RepID=UPI0025D24AF7